jgi:hypothetical protein
MIPRDRKDLLWILVASALIMMWGSIPTWAGYQAETEEFRFRGSYYDSQDYAVHIAMMEAGRHGEWAYQLRFTTEPHKPVYVRMFYVVLGHFSRWLGLPPEFTFQLARWLLGLAALLAIYTLMRSIFPDIFWARMAFLLAASGSGAGWLQLIFNWTSTKVTPIDFWLIDDYVFFSLSVFPHFALVTLAMSLTLGLWLLFLKGPRWPNIVWIGLIAILIQFVNPIAFATVDAGLLGAMLFAWSRTGRIRWIDAGALLIIAIMQLPLLTYNFIVLSNDPIWSQFTVQNQTLSPPPDYYLWGFALFWPFAIVGAITGFSKRSDALGAAIFWSSSAFVLAYAPFYIQRRFLQNITIPLAILATQGLITLFESGTARRLHLKRLQKSLAIMFVFLASLSSIQISLGQAIYLRSHPENYFYPAALDNAILWLREHAQYNDFVLASEATSQILAQRAGMRVYYGHEMETLAYETKRAKVLAFFQGSLPSLASKPIQWIVYGPAERKLGMDFQPPDGLELVYKSGELQVYKVKQDKSHKNWKGTGRD